MRKNVAGFRLDVWIAAMKKVGELGRVHRGAIGCGEVDRGEQVQQIHNVVIVCHNVVIIRHVPNQSVLQAFQVAVVQSRAVLHVSNALQEQIAFPNLDISVHSHTHGICRLHQLH